MNISYIYHSGFTIEFDSVILIFDYYKGELPKFDKDKKIYIFVSHKHHDHFNKEIFNWKEDYPYIQFILSNDVKIKRDQEEFTHFIKPDEQLQLDHLQIETLKSTDSGVAFIVTYEGQTIYHAGDLNWWHWNGESKQYNNNAKANFINEIEKIHQRHFNIAFLPLDPRQEDVYYWGFHHFMTHTKTDIAYPMHCWDDYSIIDKLIQNPIALDYHNKIMKIV